MQDRNGIGSLIGLRAEAVTPIVHAKVPIRVEGTENDLKPIELAMRRELVANDNGGLTAIDIPIITGNSQCGNIRRLLLSDLLARLDLKRAVFGERSIPDSVRVLYHTLFSGGTLGMDGKFIPEFTIESEEVVRQQWPMLSLLGASMGKSMLRSKVAFHDLIPAAMVLAKHVPSELRQSLGLVDFDPTLALVLPEDDASYAGSRAFDRRVPAPVASEPKKKKKDGASEAPAPEPAAEPDNGVPAPAKEKEEPKNPYREGIKPRTGYIPAGTPLMSWIEVDADLTDVEFGVLSRGLELLIARGRLGGWGHIGFGRAQIEVVAGELDSSAYSEWLDENHDRLVAELTGKEEPCWTTGLLDSLPR